MAAFASTHVNGNARTSQSEPKRLPPSYYLKFLSTVAKERNPNPIGGLIPLEATPGLISLLAGKPNASTFPFTELSFKARSPTDPSQELSLNVGGADLELGLQYNEAAGVQKLREWLYGLQEKMHGRKRGEGWQLSVGSGSLDLIFKAIAALVDQGDAILVESPVYAGVIPMFMTLHCELIEVETDAHGIRSSSLRSILEHWPAGKPKPKLLYTVPYGCNPTGMTATLERRKEVLKLAAEHNFMILEDDPYYYLYYGDAPRYPSYFSLERDEPETGRVLRFDSLSKILSAGIRIGFASGPKPILDAMDKHTATSSIHPSSLTQIIAFTLLNAWGYDEFHTHTKNISAFYRKKRDIFEQAMRRNLTGLVQWDSPEAGLFFWFKLLLNENNPDEEGDSEAVIRTTAFEKGVLALPGTVFLPNGGKTAYVRAAFSLASEEDVEKATQRLREAILAARATALINDI